MKRILISLISDQTIPNVLIVNELETFDEYIMISTQRMERFDKRDMVRRAADIPLEKCRHVVVIEDNLQDIAQQLHTLALKEEDHIVVNLTGGTKIMAIGVYNYFTQEVKADEMLYVPIGKNIYRTVYPIYKDTPIKYRLSLTEYLSCYGILIVERTPAIRLSQKWEVTKDYFYNNHFKSDEKYALRNFTFNRKAARLHFSELPRVFQFLPEWLKSFNYTPKYNNQIATDDLKYLDSFWFEEFMLIILSEQLNLRLKDIATGVRISRGEDILDKVDNEFDVMFTLDNALYVVECKTSIPNKEKFENTVYKLAALKKDFGLFVKGYICTLYGLRGKKNIGAIKEQKKKRASLFNITLIDEPILKSEQELEQIFGNVKART